MVGLVLTTVTVVDCWSEAEASDTVATHSTLSPGLEPTTARSNVLVIPTDEPAINHSIESVRESPSVSLEVTEQVSKSWLLGLDGLMETVAILGALLSITVEDCEDAMPPLESATFAVQEMESPVVRV